MRNSIFFDRNRAYPREESFDIFLREISKIPCLTKEEEYQLAVRVKNGDKLAEKRLIESNLKLVVHIAKRFFHKGIKTSHNDLVQEGVLGLIYGIKKFDPEMNNRLSTYAGKCIRFFIIRAIRDKSEEVRIPVHVWERMSKIKKGTHKLKELQKCEPTIKEISEEIGLEPEQIKEIMSVFQSYSIYLDEEIIDNGKTSLREIFWEEKESIDMCITNEDRLIFKSNLDFVLKLMEELSLREQEILRMRFGLGDDNSLNLKEVGKRLGITGERAGRVQDIALSKIRALIAERDMVLEEVKNDNRR
ncbi:MAG: sigma-70 family RNA polymerase sigma factor [Parcubacteria group bacterium]|nr:sigma-70 family RNA polymerase sigma factor [Parcubacteria group bacterium]